MCYTVRISRFARNDKMKRLFKTPSMLVTKNPRPSGIPLYGGGRGFHTEKSWTFHSTGPSIVQPTHADIMKDPFHGVDVDRRIRVIFSWQPEPDHALV